jgi:sporulation protein YlmC with PRC-barrel domain
MKFKNLRGKYLGTISRDTLTDSGGSAKELYIEDYEQKVLVRYENQGKMIEYETPIIVDPNNSSYRSFFSTPLVKVLYHDKGLNPRKVIDIDKLVEEFLRRGLQLHVSLAGVHIP